VLIEQENLSELPATVDVSILQPGIYFLAVNCGNIFSQVKFIKE
jgi:hypothetical protein